MMIADFKKQVQRSNEINRSLIDKIKEKELPLQRCMQERDEVMQQSELLLKDLVVLREQKEALHSESTRERNKVSLAEQEAVKWRSKYEKVKGALL